MAKKQKINKKDDERTFAFLATFLSIIGIVITLVARRDNKYVMFYAKQSIVVFVAGVLAGILASLFSIIPIMGWIIHFALNLLMFILWVASWIYALSGEQKEVPIIGHFGRRINL